MRRLVGRLLRVLLPAHTRRGRLVRDLAAVTGLREQVSGRYDHYISTLEPETWRPSIAEWQAGDPLFSVVIPAFNTPDAYIGALFDSLTNQMFPEFEVVVVDASTSSERAATLAAAAARDPRFRYHRLATNAGISANTNCGIDLARGSYVVFADHDDILSPHALNEVAARIVAHPDIDILYSDEDKMSADGLTRKSPFFKPAWSPHMFLECNYTNHLSVIRRSLIDEVGGLRSEFDGAQDYDLLLRLHSLGRSIRVEHVPSVLYHWRQSPGSTALDLHAKDYAWEAGRRALTEYFRRVNVEIDGIRHPSEQPIWYRPRPRWSVPVLVVCTDSAYTQLAALRKVTTSTVCRPTWLASKTSFDIAMLPADAQALVILREPYLPRNQTWLDDLVGALTLPNATAVAPLLVGPTDRVHSAGFVRDGLGVSNVLWSQPVHGGDLCGVPRMIRNVDAVSRAVVALKRQDLDLLDTRQGSMFSDLLVQVPAQRGHAVVWGHQDMVRRAGPPPGGYYTSLVGLGTMGLIS